MAEAKLLAFDFGAGSGRAILARLSDKISLEEIHRFNNPQIKMLDHYYWDLPYLFNELKKGLTAAGRLGHRDLLGIGVDTWGVDFGLVAADGTLLGHPVTYRDSRTEGMMDQAFQTMPKDEIYAHTGIQFMSFNTIFQLLSLVRGRSPLLSVSKRLLFMPDLMNFLMTGEMVSEYTVASTSQLLDPSTKSWAAPVFERLGLPLDLMAPIVEPGSIIAPLHADLCQETGLGPINVIASASHDTASAVAAVPAKGENWAYLSSGTWSLIGIETKQPIINDRSFANSFTNEGGVSGTIRFLRNVMGMWLLEQCRKKWAESGLKDDYDELLHLAGQARPFACIINPDDPRFLNPSDMPAAIADYCRETGQSAPDSAGAMVRCILESLALKYKYVLQNIETLRQQKLDVLHIVGGGSQNDLLNQFTADATGLQVIAGPVEATALGNILVQAMATRHIASLTEGRELISRSFSLKTFLPTQARLWHEKFEQFQSLFSAKLF